MYGWQDSYSVGVPAFDTDHQQLFAYFDDFHIALKEGRSQQIIGETLDKIYAYTRRHFQSEEDWMFSKGDPDLIQHRKQHRDFQQQILSLIEDNKAGKIALSAKVSKTLREWLTGHILGTDQKYAQRFQTRTAG